MMFPSHNFYHNFANAAGVNDFEMQKDIVIDELAKSLISNKRDIILIAAKNNVPLKFEDTPETIGVLLIKNINDKKFANDLASFLCKKNSSDLQAEGFESADGEGKSKKLADILDNQEIQDFVADTILSITDRKNKTKSEKKLKKQIQNYNDKPQKNNKKIWKYVFAGITLVAITVVVYFYYKNKKQNG